MNDPTFRRAFALLIAVALLHAAGARLYLYWSIWWYDILMHFLGGVSVGLGAIWLHRRGAFKLPMRIRGDAWAALAGIAIIGLAWEIFEYAAGVTFVANGYVADTLTDLAMDTIGALCAVLYDRQITRRVSANISAQV